MVCSRVYHPENGASVRSCRLDLHGSAVWGVAVDPGAASRRELQAEQLGRHSLSDVPDKVAV